MNEHFLLFHFITMLSIWCQVASRSNSRPYVDPIVSTKDQLSIWSINSNDHPDALSTLGKSEEDYKPSSNATLLIEHADYAIISETVVDSGDGVFVFENNRTASRNIIQSSLVENGTIIRVDFSYLMISMFGGADLISGPISSSSSAILKIKTYTFSDIAVRQQ